MHTQLDDLGFCLLCSDIFLTEEAIFSSLRFPDAWDTEFPAFLLYLPVELGQQLEHLQFHLRVHSPDPAIACYPQNIQHVLLDRLEKPVSFAFEFRNQLVFRSAAGYALHSRVALQETAHFNTL
jgi:hypothetical protein